MTDINATVERIKSANAVPSTDSFPTGAWSSADLLVRIDERNKTMTDTLTPVRKIDPAQPPGRGRGPLIAFAAAAVLILVIGVAAFNVLTGDNQPEVTDPVPTTTTAAPTTTTVAPTPDAVQLPAPPVPADTPPLEVLAGIQAAWDAGDMDAAHALMWPESGYFTQLDWVEGIAQEIQQRYATNMTVERECSLGNPAELQDRPLSVPQGVMITCEETLISGLQPGERAGGGRFAAEVADGWVIDFFIFDYQGAVFESPGVELYAEWMQEQRFSAGAFEELFRSEEFNPDLVMVVDTPEARQRHRDLIPAFIGDTAPRSELAMRSDTPFEEVVQVFHDRFDSGDVTGWEALFHPGNNYSAPRSEAAASHFMQVTGASTERDCTTIVSETMATQVRCIERQTSGLVPGFVSEDVVVVYTGHFGWLWGIDFPNGRPASLSSLGNAPGVADYRLWVVENMPDRADTLFAFGATMDLDTEEVRELHKETIAAYLAATG